MSKKYLTAKELGINPITYHYLKYAAETLPKLNTPQKLNDGTFGFNMDLVLCSSNVNNPLEDFEGKNCETAGCILGLMLYKGTLDGQDKYWHLQETFEEDVGDLFYPQIRGKLRDVTNVQAAKAVETFLTTKKITFGALDCRKRTSEY